MVFCIVIIFSLHLIDTAALIFLFNSFVLRLCVSAGFPCFFCLYALLLHYIVYSVDKVQPYFCLHLWYL